MRNSAWYYKLWLKKLSKLPLKEDAGSAWAGMKDMLDARMPVSNGGGKSDGSSSGGSNGGGTVATKPFAAKLVSLLGYALPVAAAIGVTTYLVSPVVIRPKNPVILKKQQSHLPADTLHRKGLPVSADSLANIETDSAHVLSIDSLSGYLTGVKAKTNGTNKQISDLRPAAVSKIENNQVENYAVKVQPDHSENIVSPGTSLVKENTASTIESIKPDKEENQIPVNEKISGKHSTAKVASSKKKKVSRSPKVKEFMTTPAYNFGLESGWNTGKNDGLYVGIFGSYRIRTKLLLNVGVRLNTSTTLSGSYITKPSGYLRDTLSTYKVSDNRKLMLLNVPLTLEYRLSNQISINAGPVISFPLSQSKGNTQSELYKAQLPSTKYLDSARHRAVDSTLNYTKVNKVNLGITGGISIRFNQFYMEGKYLRNLTPYKVSNTLGGYQQYNGSFQLGLRYQFKK